MSFVQIRGSIPVIWTQPTDGSYRPKIVIEQSELNTRTLANHFDKTIPRYKKIHIINLIDQVGHELPLGREYTRCLEEYNSDSLEYIPFDFHTVCKNMKWNNISILMKRISDNLRKQQYFHIDDKSKVIAEQKGVYRTNCIDCIDRTNVIQMDIAKTVLTEQLKASGVFADSDDLESFPDLDLLHRTGILGEGQQSHFG